MTTRADRHSVKGHKKGQMDDRPTTDADRNKTTPKCGQPRSGKSSKGPGTCQNDAGWGTDHPGTGPCKLHGGNNPTYLKHLSLERVRQDLRAASERTYGTPVHLDPWQGMLQEVQRTAGHIQWLSDKIAAIGDVNEIEALQQWTVMGIKPSFWLEQYQEERKHFARICKMAIDSGIAERQVALAEEQGKLLAMAIRAILWDDALGLTPQQRSVAPAIIRRHLLALPTASAEGYPVNGNTVEIPQATAQPTATPTA